MVQAKESEAYRIVIQCRPKEWLVTVQIGKQLGFHSSPIKQRVEECRSKEKKSLTKRKETFGSFTSFTRLFIARPKGLALGYSFASLSHKGFPIPSFTIVQSVIGLYLLNVHSLFVRSLLLLRVLTNTQCST